jgi:predicted nucleic-acid-binding protein
VLVLLEQEQEQELVLGQQELVLGQQELVWVLQVQELERQEQVQELVQALV